MSHPSVSIALTGSGGAGVMTAGQMLLTAAARAGCYGLMSRSLGPQIRGGESAALLRLSTGPVDGPDDIFDLLVAFDWGNIDRFAAELPLNQNSVVIYDPAQGPVPEIVREPGPRLLQVPFKELAKSVSGGRENMVGLGLITTLIGLDPGSLRQVLEENLGRKGPDAVAASWQAVEAGARVADIDGLPRLDQTRPAAPGSRWQISGNDAVGLGSLRGGVRFVAAYPITPATEILEWMAVNLPKVGGALVQCEDELASVCMALGGSYAGVPSMTATAGPGLALMTEAIGLGVASETPVVIANVMRGGPSTGIPTKSEQSDLNIACYGLHGDAPHIVTAATSIADCVFTAQWSVYLAEALQCPVILLSDQTMGQAQAVIDKPAEVAFIGRRKVARPADLENYQRYRVTADGISPVALPGMPGGQHTADGLEHSPTGTPSTQAAHHQEQLDKRRRKLEKFDYGDHWAIREGDPEAELALITFGSLTGAARDAMTRCQAAGLPVRLISPRLLLPVQVERLEAALAGAKRLLIVEQNHEAQLRHLLTAHVRLPEVVSSLNRAGPLTIRPGEIVNALKDLAA